MSGPWRALNKQRPRDYQENVKFSRWRPTPKYQDINKFPADCVRHYSKPFFVGHLVFGPCSGTITCFPESFNRAMAAQPVAHARSRQNTLIPSSIRTISVAVAQSRVSVTHNRSQRLRASKCNKRSSVSQPVVQLPLLASCSHSIPAWKTICHLHYSFMLSETFPHVLSVLLSPLSRVEL